MMHFSGNWMRELMEHATRAEGPHANLTIYTAWTAWIHIGLGVKARDHLDCTVTLEPMTMRCLVYA